MVQGVGQQVDEDASDLVGAAGDFGGFQVGLDADVALLGERPEGFEALLREEGEVGGDALAPVGAGVEPGEFEEGFGEAAHFLGGLFAGAEGVAVFPRGAIAAQGGLGFGEDDGQGGAEFVGGVGGELLLAGEGGVEAGEGGVEDVGQFAEFAVHAGGGDPFGEGSFGDAPDGAEGEAGEEPAAAEAEEQHEGAGAGQAPGEAAEAGQVGGDVAADEDAVAHFGEVVGLAADAARPMADGGSGPGGRGPGEGRRPGGGLGEHGAFVAPDGEIASGDFVELVGHGRGQGEGRAGKGAHARTVERRPDNGEGREAFEIRRRFPVIAGTVAGPEHLAAEGGADRFDAACQFGVDLVHRGALLELVGGGAEAGGQGQDQQAEPEQQTEPDGGPEHAYFPMQ